MARPLKPSGIRGLVLQSIVIASVLSSLVSASINGWLLYRMKTAELRQEKIRIAFELTKLGDPYAPIKLARYLAALDEIERTGTYVEK